MFGGSTRGWTWDVIYATFSQNRWCRRESRLSIEFPLYSTTNAFSHVHATSCLEAECVSSTLACWRNEWLAWNFLREAPFPILWRRYVVSHPRTAYRKNMCWHMSGPRLCFVTLMFQMCGCFVVFFGSGQRKRSCDSMLEWWQRRMRRSVSSPTSTVLLELADYTAFITIRRSALPEAWCTSQLFFFNSSLSMKMKHCLFCLLVTFFFLSSWWQACQL